MIFGKRKYTQEELLQGCADNDRRSQEALYNYFFPEMMRMCLRHTQDEETAMQIVNSGFLRAFKKIDTFEGRGSLEGWLRRLIWHCLADHFRQQKKYSQFIVLEEPSVNIRHGEHSDDHLAEEDILSMVRELPENTQKVFILYAVEGFTHKEIGEKLNLSEGTSKWHLNLARTRLKERLKAEFSQEISTRKTGL